MPELRPRQLEVLRLFEKGPWSVYGVEQRLTVATSTAERHVRSLERSGHIQATGSGRLASRILTQQGQEALRKAASDA